MLVDLNRMMYGELSKILFLLDLLKVIEKPIEMNSKGLLEYLMSNYLRIKHDKNIK